MRILFICQFFAPDITAAAFRMTDFARLLSAAGDEIRVITSFPHKAQVVDVDDSEFERAGITVLRCPLREVHGGGARAYLKHYLSFVWGSLRLGMRTWREGWRPDVIYVSSPPLFVGLTGRALAKLFRRPVVFEVRDIWPDAAVSAGQLRAGGRAYRLGQILERYFYRHANAITCVAEPMREYLQRWTRVPITVVYNGVRITEPAPPLAQRDSHTPVRDRVILYAGNMGHVQQMDLLVQGFAELMQDARLSGWQVHLLGAGARLEDLQDQAKQLGVSDRIRFLPAVDRQDAARQIAAADVLYLHLMHDDTMAKTIPSKLFDYLLAARPIVGGLSGEGAQILESTGANVVFSPGDLAGLKQALIQVVESWPTLDAKAGANRELVKARFTREQAAAVLRSVFQGIAAAGSS